LLLLLLFRGCVEAKTFRSACLRIQLRRCFWLPFLHSSNVLGVSMSITDSASVRGSPSANRECLEGMRVVGVYVCAVHDELEIGYVLVDIAVLHLEVGELLLRTFVLCVVDERPLEFLFQCLPHCHVEGKSVGVVLDLLEPCVHALRLSLNQSAFD
jgi:hypothetical protein